MSPWTSHTSLPALWAVRHAENPAEALEVARRAGLPDELLRDPMRIGRPVVWRRERLLGVDMLVLCRRSPRNMTSVILVQLCGARWQSSDAMPCAVSWGRLMHRDQPKPDLSDLPEVDAHDSRQRQGPPIGLRGWRFG